MHYLQVYTWMYRLQYANWADEYKFIFRFYCSAIQKSQIIPWFIQNIHAYV